MIPNLEIMKLATYYRQEENTFCRLIDLNETELGAYDKIYFFSEINREINVPDAFRAAENVAYGGSAFTKGKYQPFENEIIDYTIAKPFVYKEILKQRFQAGAKIKAINHVLDDSYYRMRANDNKLPIPPIIAKKRVYLFDRDIFYDDWQDVLQNIVKRNPSMIVPIHPVYCRTLADYFTIRNFNRFSRASTFILDINIPLTDVAFMLKKYKNKFLADVTKTSTVYLELGGTCKTSYDYYKDLVYKINLLYSFWSSDIPIKTKFVYSEDNTNPIQDLEKEIVKWINGDNFFDKYTTMDERLEGRGKISNKKNAYLRDQRDIVLKYFPNASGLFKQSYANLRERKVWRI